MRTSLGRHKAAFSHDRVIFHGAQGRCVVCNGNFKKGAALLDAPSGKFVCCSAEESVHLGHPHCMTLPCLGCEAEPKDEKEPGTQAEEQAEPRRLLGIDIGGVIVPHYEESGGSKEDTLLGKNWKAAVARQGCFEAISQLVNSFGAENCHIVSKAGSRVEATSRAWLRHVRLCETTGLPTANVHFVRKRSDKAVLCASLGPTAHWTFIDDNLDVIAPQVFSRGVLFVNSEQRLLDSKKNTVFYSPRIEIVRCWEDVVDLLL